MDNKTGFTTHSALCVPIKSKDPVAEEIWNFIDMILNKSFYLAPFHNYYQSFMLARKMIENLPIHSVAE